MTEAALIGVSFLGIFTLLFILSFRYAMADESETLFEDKWIKLIFIMFSAFGLALCIHLNIPGSGYHQSAIGYRQTG